MASNIYKPGSTDDPNAVNPRGTEIRGIQAKSGPLEIAEPLRGKGDMFENARSLRAIPAPDNLKELQAAQTKAQLSSGMALKAVGKGVPTGHALAPERPTPAAPATPETPASSGGIIREGNSFTGKDAEYDPSGTPLAVEDVNLANERTQRANAVRQSMLDDPNLGGGGPRVGYIPNSQALETQKLFDKWANEALIKEAMGQRGGVGAVASIQNAYTAGNNQIAALQQQGQNQLAGLDVSGRTQRDVAQLQGSNHLAGIDAQGRNALAVAEQTGVDRQRTQELENKGRLEHGKQMIDANKEIAGSNAFSKHFDALPKLLEAMDPKDPDYKEFMGLYKEQLLGQRRARQQAASDPYADARAAIATGRITQEEANKRLASAGLKPI